MTIEQTIQNGLEAQRQGRMGEAIGHYRTALEQDPGNVDALNLMSVIAVSASDPGGGLSFALSAAAAQPDWFGSYINIGNAAQQLGHLPEAIISFRRAIFLQPRSAEAFINLSNALCIAGHPSEAADMAVEAILLAPSHADAHNNFGNALLALNSPGEAVEAYQKALALDETNDRIWLNMANAQVALKNFIAAEDCYRHSIALCDDASKHVYLANTLALLHNLPEAEAEYGKALALAPDHGDALNNLGVLLRDRGRLDQAEAVLRRGLAQAPDAADLHWNLALVLLTLGRYQEGWAEYEWRWGTPQFAQYVRDYPSAAWTGQPLEGRSILVHLEQGFGDAIEFCRLVPRLADQGARVVLECRKGLGRLLATLDQRITVVEAGTDIPPCDYHVAMMSLPHRLGLTLDTIPAKNPYLKVPDGAASFADVARRTGLKVGVVWSGSNTRRDNNTRSFRPDSLSGLPGVSLFSLQVGDASSETAALIATASITDLSPRLSDFADTAAAIEALDLVISADTAVAHLAGALGKPVWVLLPAPTSAFLWMTDRSDSPWYPSVRLFRQTIPGNWSPVMGEIRRLLGEMVDSREG